MVVPSGLLSCMWSPVETCACFPHGYSGVTSLGRASRVKRPSCHVLSPRHQPDSLPLMLTFITWGQVFLIFWLCWVFVSARAFSRCSEWDLLLIEEQRLTVAVTSLMAKRLWGAQASVVAALALDSLPPSCQESLRGLCWKHSFSEPGVQSHHRVSGRYSVRLKVKHKLVFNNRFRSVRSTRTVQVLVNLPEVLEGERLLCVCGR